MQLGRTLAWARCSDVGTASPANHELVRSLGATTVLDHAAGPISKQLEEHGLKPGDIRRQSSALLASEEVGDVFHGGRAYDVHVRAIPEARNSFTDVANLQIDTPSGEKVKLSEDLYDGLARLGDGS